MAGRPPRHARQILCSRLSTLRLLARSNFRALSDIILRLLSGIRLNHTKNAIIQSVPMHPRVMGVLHPIWEERRRPLKGRGFLNRFGKPYQDTRKANIPGGNPIKNQHATACQRAGIEDFTVHD